MAVLVKECMQIKDKLAEMEKKAARCEEEAKQSKMQKQQLKSDPKFEETKLELEAYKAKVKQLEGQLAAAGHDDDSGKNDKEYRLLQSKHDELQNNYDDLVVEFNNIEAQRDDYKEKLEEINEELVITKDYLIVPNTQDLLVDKNNGSKVGDNFNEVEVILLILLDNGLILSGTRFARQIG
jgi:hypothetical protein